MKVKIQVTSLHPQLVPQRQDFELEGETRTRRSPRGSEKRKKHRPRA